MNHLNLGLLCLAYLYLFTHAADIDKIRRQRLNMRCTRRFTPGVCADAVRPVWTFDFFAQNCTERLGCMQSTRSNRFLSYATCMRSCRAFIDLYTQTLLENDEQSKRLRSEMGETSGRKGGRLFQAKFYEQEDNYQEMEQEIWDSPVVRSVGGDDAMVVNEMLAPDIDYAGVQVNNEECDLMHHVRTAAGIN